MKIECPSRFAYGHSHQIYSDFGHHKIPPDSDINYELEIISCKYKRWDALHQVDFQAGKATTTEADAKVKVAAKLSIHDEKKELKVVGKKILSLKQDIVELDKLVIKQETDAAKIKVEIVSAEQKTADASKKVNLKKKPEETEEEKKEKEEELAKTKNLLFTAKNNLIKVDKALKVAENAVKNEETVV